MAALHPPYASPDAIPLPNIDSLTDSDAVDKIDAEIARFEDHIRSLRQLRNSVVPVSHFPAEILSKVFLHYHEQDEMDTKRTLTISWVSRQWRSVVLEQPALWSVICVSLPYDEEIVSPSAIEYVQQCLIRSRNAPLAITYSGPRSVVLNMCSSQLHRICKLHISHYFTADEQLPFIEEWQHPAPLLVDL
ncbi:hypothetical protein BDN72DRAFT_901793 [Pluteus cervinus]|uniref:Uncharacterized protein n=1 Tax=Pluteus cervinus TaxID=181527 RepID=A0ACD3AEG6_9AGAR|nr:hypothetical protein BDN72DRAFT_901793 [Pluteus cervinus]